MALHMPELAKPLARGSAYGSRAVRPDAQVQLETRVSEERLLSKADAAGTYHAVVLGLAAAEGQADLCSRPSLDDVVAHHQAAA